VPALHRAVLHDEDHTPLRRVRHEWRQHVFGEPQVLGDRSGDVATDERADQRAAQRGGLVDAAAQVVVDPLAFGRVVVQQVLVVGDGRHLQPVPAQHVAGRRVEVARLPRPAGVARPRRHLERGVALPGGPPGDRVERLAGQARGEETKPHRGSRW
jgi:hypothetical protein